MRLWDLTSVKRIRSFSSVQRLWFTGISPDGKYAMSATRSHGGILKMWDTGTGQKISAFRARRPRGRSDSVRLECAAYSPDGRYAFAGTSDGLLLLREMASGKLIRSFGGHSGSVDAVAFSPDGSYALSRCKSDRDSAMKLWDLSSGKEIRSFEDAWPRESCLGSVQFSPDGRFVLASADRGISLWSVSSGKETCRFYSFSDGEWFAVTHEGFYNASPKGHKYLSVRSGDHIQAVEPHKEQWFRPDVVQAVLETPI